MISLPGGLAIDVLANSFCKFEKSEFLIVCASDGIRRPSSEERYQREKSHKRLNRRTMLRF